jgi:hypothetical protein
MIEKNYKELRKMCDKKTGLPAGTGSGEPTAEKGSDLNVIYESRRYFYIKGKPVRKSHCKKCHGIVGLDKVCRNCGMVVN